MHRIAGLRRLVSLLWVCGMGPGSISDSTVLFRMDIGFYEGVYDDPYENLYVYMIHVFLAYRKIDRSSRGRVACNPKTRTQNLPSGPAHDQTTWFPAVQVASKYPMPKYNSTLTGRGSLGKSAEGLM